MQFIFRFGKVLKCWRDPSSRTPGIRPSAPLPNPRLGKVARDCHCVDRYCERCSEAGYFVYSFNHSLSVVIMGFQSKVCWDDHYIMEICRNELILVEFNLRFALRNMCSVYPSDDCLQHSSLQIILLLVDRRRGHIGLGVACASCDHQRMTSRFGLNVMQKNIVRRSQMSIAVKPLFC